MRSKPWFILPLMSAMACSAGEDRTQDAASRVEDEAAARELTSSFDEAVNSKNIDALMTRYADGAVRMNPNVPAVVGKEAIRAAFLEVWQSRDVATRNEIIELRISGDLAVTRGRWAATTTQRSGGDAFEDSGKWMATLERQPDGSWKSLWEIWSSDLPARPSQ